MKWCPCDEVRVFCARAARRARPAAWLAALAAACAVPAARADSAWSSGAAAMPLAARAHLDFRVTVLPSMGLRLEGGDVTVVGTQGLVLMAPPAAAESTPVVAVRPRTTSSRVVVPVSQPGAAGAAPYTLVSP